MAPAEDDDMAADRVFDRRRASQTLWVASDLGVTRVAVAGANVGRFSLAVEGSARDVVTLDEAVFVATEEGVLRGSADGFESTGFGPAVAVGTADGDPVAVSPTGELATFTAGAWSTRGTVPSAVRRIDWPLIAAADGVYHCGQEVEHAGLDDARDVAAGGPYAATGTGLFVRQDGWTKVLSGEATVVAAAAGEYVVVDGRLRAHRRDSWDPCTLPTEDDVTDLAAGDRIYAVTRSGTLLVAEDEAEADGPSWRSRDLGLAEARALAVS